MKRIFRLLLIAALAIVCAFGAAACSNGGKGKTKSGLLIKKFDGEDFYTVYGYAGSDESLDLTAYNNAEDGIEIGRIKEGAFTDNNTIREITVPATVKTIDAGAFRNMKKLQKITLPFIGANAQSDAYLGETGKAEEKAVNEERVFAYVFGTESYEGGVSVTANYGSSTASYYLPSTLTEVVVAPGESYSLPMYAFCDVTQITKVELCSGVDAIGAYAFKGCGVQTVKIATTVKNIYESAFLDTARLKTLDFTGLELESIGESAFKGTKLTEIEVTVAKIGNYAFTGSALKTVTLKGVESIGAWALADCEKIVAIAIEAKGATLDKGVYCYGDTASEKITETIDSGEEQD